MTLPIAAFCIFIFLIGIYFSLCTIEEYEKLKRIEKIEVLAEKIFLRITRDPVICLKNLDVCGCENTPQIFIYKSVYNWPEFYKTPLTFIFYDVQNKCDVKLTWRHIHDNMIEI